jgi:hypothetical protein
MTTRRALHASDPAAAVAASDHEPVTPASLQRAAAMAMLREQGHGLDEIARRFDVSRERVRQILRTHGGPDSRDVAEARRRRAERQLEERAGELLARWRAGEEMTRAAKALGLSVVACRTAIERYGTEADRVARKTSLARTRAVTPRYTERDIIAAVSAVAANLGRVPRVKEYVALARELGLPCLTTVANRMGGWTNAVRATGLRPVSIPPRARPRRWTAEACWAAMHRVVDELGQIPTVGRYDRHTADRPDLPSSETVRLRLGRWSAITTQLAAERQLTP